MLSAAVKHGVTSCSLISTHALLGVLAVRAGSCSGLYVLLQWGRQKLESCVGECHADSSEKPALIPWERCKVATCVGECHAVSSEKPALVPWERYKSETCVGECHADSSGKPAEVLQGLWQHDSAKLSQPTNNSDTTGACYFVASCKPLLQC